MHQKDDTEMKEGFISVSSFWGIVSCVPRNGQPWP